MYHNWYSDNDLPAYSNRNICILQNNHTMNITDVSYYTDFKGKELRCETIWTNAERLFLLVNDRAIK